MKRGRPRVISAKEMRRFRNAGPTRPPGPTYRRAMQNYYYCRRALRILCYGSVEVSRTMITREAETRWPWLFDVTVSAKGDRRGFYQRAQRRRRTVLTALGRCHPVAVPVFADRLCELAPGTAKGASLVRHWRKQFDAIVSDPNADIEGVAKRVVRREMQPLSHGNRRGVTSV